MFSGIIITNRITKTLLPLSFRLFLLCIKQVHIWIRTKHMDPDSVFLWIWIWIRSISDRIRNPEAHSITRRRGVDNTWFFFVRQFLKNPVDGLGIDDFVGYNKMSDSGQPVALLTPRAPPQLFCPSLIIECYSFCLMKHRPTGFDILKDKACVMAYTKLALVHHRNSVLILGSYLIQNVQSGEWQDYYHFPSSRGMSYKNDELKLLTINLNKLK